MMHNQLLKEWGIKKWHIRFLIAFTFLALFHPFIANEKYIIGTDDVGLSLFLPISEGHKGIKTFIPYSDNYIDKDNRGVSPFQKQNVTSIYYRHWFGTDTIGRDVLAGILYGTSIAFKIGFVTTILTLVIGILFGFLSAYLGDHTIRISVNYFIILCIISLICIFYIYYIPSPWKWFLSLIPSAFLILYYTTFDYKVREGLPIQLDIIILRIIEILRSIPGVFLILVLLSLFSTANIWNVVIVISFLSWPTVTRHLRAEILKIKKEDFISSARVAGLSHIKIFKDYILPLTISSVIIVSSFGFATAILLESSLSFLGIGIPIDQVSWGSMLRDARMNISSWWLAFFPGLMIYLIIFLFNSIGNCVLDRFHRIEKEN